MTQLNRLNRFSSMDFPPYDRKEYPKHINRANGTYIEINSAAEEQDALARIAQEEAVTATSALEVSPAPMSVAHQEFDERAALITRAEELDIAWDKRWGLKKLREIIAAAEIE